MAMLHKAAGPLRKEYSKMANINDIAIDEIQITDTSDDLDGSLIQDVLLVAGGSSSSSSSSSKEILEV
jgi:ribulose 1,5-bisphosphate synthetase/thiazole synthase